MSAGYIVLYLVFLNNLSRFLKTMLCAYRKLLYELSQHPYIFVCVRRCDVSQLHIVHGGPGAIGCHFDVAMLVALERTVAALVALLAEPPRYSLSAYFANCATTKMFSNKSMLIIDMKLNALPPPS